MLRRNLVKNLLGIIGLGAIPATVLAANSTSSKKRTFKLGNVQYHTENDEVVCIEYADSSKQYYKNGKLHRDNDLPAIEYSNGRKEWWFEGLLHRDNDLPAIEDMKGSKEWYQKGLHHRDNDLPAVYYVNEVGKSYSEIWYQKDKRHRDGDSPAIIEYVEGKIFSKHWYKDGLKHRDGDFPATELYSDRINGALFRPYKEYYKKGFLHRDDDALGNQQPAKIYSDLRCEYYKNGFLIKNIPKDPV